MESTNSQFDLDDALESIGITVEDTKDTVEKLRDNTPKDDNVLVSATEAEKNKRFYVMEGVSEADRAQAVTDYIIPDAYRNSMFDIEKIKANIQRTRKRDKLHKVKNFNKYAGICEKILMDLRMDKLPKMSYIIGAPNGFGKTSFVTECLITLRHYRVNVVPYISLWELAQLKVENEVRLMKPFKKFTIDTPDGSVTYIDPDEQKYEVIKRPKIVVNNFSYSEYINADCLFVFLSGIESKEIESYTLKQVLSIRGAKGLPTIVMCSESLLPYENDQTLKEYVWGEIKAYSEELGTYDRVYHISCYKDKTFTLNNADDEDDI